MVDYLREHHEMDWKNEQYETQSLSENEFLSKFALIFWFVTESASGCVKGSTLDGLGVEGAGPGVGVGSSSSCLQYDRSHVTGASSSSSSGPGCYPHETLNPPPSPATDTRSRVGVHGANDAGSTVLLFT